MTLLISTAKYFTAVFLAILFVFVTTTASTAVTRGKKIPKNVRSESGLNIPEWGIAIDAVYDSRLDDLIPGFKILNVVLTNRSPDTIYLDPAKDKWTIRDSVGKKYDAINHLRLEDEGLWLGLPAGLREKLEYPHAVRVGYSTEVDLFFPAKTDLAHFREISWQSSHFGRKFDILTTMEKNLKIEPKEKPIPDTHSYRQSLEKYENEKARGETPPTEQRSPPFNSPTNTDTENLAIPMD